MLIQLTNIITGGGTFAFNPAVTDGATIDASTGEISNGVGGTDYIVEYSLPGSCAPSSTETVTVNALPAINAGVDQDICEGDAVVLNGENGISYVWDNGVTDGVSFNPTASGTYTVIGTDANGCTNSDVVDLTVSTIPTVSLSASPATGTAPLVVIFTNQSTNATNFVWEYGNGITDLATNTNDQTTTYTTAGTYVTTLTAVNGACSAQDTVMIVVLEPDGPIVTPPNVFTPNGDLTNDEWYIKTQNVATIEVVILNRWGNVMSEYSGVDGFWDGDVKGKPAVEGVYFYKFTAVGINGEEVDGHGHLSLIRE